MPTPVPRYTLKADAHSSHSVVLGWLGEGRGRYLLDVGAADGLLSRHLSERGWQVTAIEGNPAAAAGGAAYCHRMIVADLDGDLPALDGAFDVILYADVLEHLRDPLRVLRGLNRTLAPGGEIVVSIPNVAHLWIRLSLLAGRFDYGNRGILDRTHLRFFTWRSVRTLLSDAGFRVVRRTATPAPLPEVVPAQWRGTWLTVAHGTNAALARRLPRLLGYQFVVLARPDGGQG